MAKGSVILTHLIDGDPQGIRRVTMKNKTCEMYVIPRSLFSEAKVCKAIDLKQPALYILLENINSFADENPKLTSVRQKMSDKGLNSISEERMISFRQFWFLSPPTIP